MTSNQATPARLSRKLYVLWATALTLLLALGLFCWLVVVPYLQIRNAVVEFANTPASAEAEFRPTDFGGKASAVRKLTLFLRVREEPERHRKAVAAMLGRCGAHAVPVLVETYGRETGSVQHAAIAALGDTGSEEAVPTLIAALKDQELRWQAVRSLGRLGAKARSAKPRLESLMQTERFDRPEVINALGLMFGQADSSKAVGKEAVAWIHLFYGAHFSRIHLFINAGKVDYHSHGQGHSYGYQRPLGDADLSKLAGALLKSKLFSSPQAPVQQPTAVYHISIGLKNGKVLRRGMPHGAKGYEKATEWLADSKKKFVGLLGPLEDKK